MRTNEENPWLYYGGVGTWHWCSTDMVRPVREKFWRDFLQGDFDVAPGIRESSTTLGLMPAFSYTTGSRFVADGSVRAGTK
jgi:hypothetical protein